MLALGEVQTYYFLLDLGSFKARQIICNSVPPFSGGIARSGDFSMASFSQFQGKNYS